MKGRVIMNKKELIQEVATATGETIKATEKIINQTLTTIQSKLAAGEKVELKNFGLFGVKDVAERKGTNPRTGEEITIPAHKFPFFKASSILKKSVNNNDD